MSPDSHDRHRWLDSLARWAAGGRPRPRPADKALVDSVAVISGGTTRRTALRTAAGAAGAVALSGPLSLLQSRPAFAAASERSVCREDARKKARDDFQACVKGPLQAFEASEESIVQNTEYLRNQKKPAARRRLKKLIAGATRERAKAVRELEFCNGVYIGDTAEGESQCEQSGGGSAGSGGGGSGGANGTGCETGFTFCADHCCDLSNAYCQNCPSKVICCRQGENCCPSG